MLTLMTADLRAAPSGLLDGGPKGGRGRQRRLPGGAPGPEPRVFRDAPAEGV